MCAGLSRAIDLCWVSLLPTEKERERRKKRKETKLDIKQRYVEVGVKALLTSSLVWFYEVSESVITYSKNNKECGFQNVAGFFADHCRSLWTWTPMEGQTPFILDRTVFAGLACLTFPVST